MNTQSGMLFVETGEDSLPCGLILLYRDNAFSMGSVQVQQFLSHGRVVGRYRLPSWCP